MLTLIRRTTMTDAILLAYKDVERSMERFTQLLQSHVETMGTTPSHDSDRAFRLSQGSKAMRDSAMIYLSYAKYVAYGLPERDDLVHDELQGCIPVNGNRYSLNARRTSDRL